MANSGRLKVGDNILQTL